MNLRVTQIVRFRIHMRWEGLLIFDYDIYQGKLLSSSKVFEQQALISDSCSNEEPLRRIRKHMKPCLHMTQKERLEGTISAFRE